MRKHIGIAKGLVSMDQAVEDEAGADGLVDGLSPREELLLCLRFEIDMGGDRVLEQIGQSLLETRQRIKEIEAKARRKQQPGRRQGRLRLSPCLPLAWQASLRSIPPLFLLCWMRRWAIEGAPGP